MFNGYSAMYVFQDPGVGQGGWVPLQVASFPETVSFTTLSRTFGRTFPDDSTFKEVYAAQPGLSFTPAGPNPVEPIGLFTIACSYAMNAALTQIVPARMVDETAATLTATANASYRVASIAYAYNGTAFVRVLSASATNLATQAPNGAMLTASPGEWSINHTPVANTQATISRAAVAGQRHVCRSISATLIGLAASAETTVLVNLRDGASGAGTILYSTRLLVTGTTGSQTGVGLSDLNIVGSVNTAMTLEFAAAGGANTFEAVNLTGFTAA